MMAAIIAAFLAAAFATAAAHAVPIAPGMGAASTPGAASVETVQFRGGNWRDHPLMYRGNWEWHQRQWDAIEGRGGYARSNPCARLRSYDPASHTFVNRDGRRVRCR